MAKLTVEISDNLNSVLEDLAKKEEIPKTQVLRRSIALMKIAEDEKDEHRKLAVVDQGDNVVKEILT